ncbi:MAG: hypothetical protein HRU20_30820 [Pseudomonadales bacterium]|nr:hypothetical protein [Pseudomonadales bacterium]
MKKLVILLATPLIVAGITCCSSTTIYPKKKPRDEWRVGDYKWTAFGTLSGYIVANVLTGGNLPAFQMLLSGGLPGGIIGYEVGDQNRDEHKATHCTGHCPVWCEFFNAPEFPEDCPAKEASEIQ